MATQEITLDAFATLCAECSDEIAAGNFKTAASKYAQAQAVHVGLLNMSISTGTDSVTRINSLAALKDAIEFAMKLGGDEDDGRFVSVSTRH